MVTETIPTYPGQKPGTDECTSRVVTAGEQTLHPTPGKGDPRRPPTEARWCPRTSGCTDVSLSAWTDMFQHCPHP